MKSGGAQRKHPVTELEVRPRLLRYPKTTATGYMRPKLPITLLDQAALTLPAALLARAGFEDVGLTATYSSMTSPTEA